VAVPEEDVRVRVVPGHEWLEVELAQPHDTGQGRGRAGGRGVTWTRRRSGRCGEGGDDGERARLGSSWDESTGARLRPMEKKCMQIQPVSVISKLAY
jgi:hypothetical protein